jgi:hypothetical protein
LVVEIFKIVNRIYTCGTVEEQSVNSWSILSVSLSSRSSTGADAGRRSPLASPESLGKSKQPLVCSQLTPYLAIRQDRGIWSIDSFFLDDELLG